MLIPLSKCWSNNSFSLGPKSRLVLSLRAVCSTVVLSVWGDDCWLTSGWGTIPDRQYNKVVPEVICSVNLGVLAGSNDPSVGWSERFLFLFVLSAFSEIDNELFKIYLQVKHSQDNTQVYRFTCKNYLVNKTSIFC